MREMVISCMPDGSIQHTLKDAFLKPFDGQERSVKRMSEIVHETKHDMFYVNLGKIEFPGKGKIAKTTMFGPVTFHDLRFFNCHSMLYDFPHRVDIDDDAEDGIVLFNTYEQAVSVEIALINAMRLAGGRFID